MQRRILLAAKNGRGFAVTTAVSLRSQQDETTSTTKSQSDATPRESWEDAKGETCFTFTSRTYSPQCRRVTLARDFRMTNHRFGNSQQSQGFSPCDYTRFAFFARATFFPNLYENNWKIIFYSVVTWWKS